MSSNLLVYLAGRVWVWLVCGCFVTTLLLLFLTFPLNQFHIIAQPVTCNLIPFIYFETYPFTR